MVLSVTPSSVASIAMVVALLMIIAVMKTRRSMCAYAVGGSAALIGVQLSNIHLFSFTVALWAIFSRPTGSRQWPRVLMLAAAVGLLCTTVFFGELVSSPTLALQLIAMSGAAALIALRANERDVAEMMRAALVVITVGAVIGLLQFVGVLEIELWHTDVSTLGRPIGIWPEPDWLGMMAGVGAILAWHLPMPGKWRAGLLTVNSAAFILAFARAAWLGLAVAVAVAVLVRLFAERRGERRSGRRGSMLTLLVVGIVALLMNPTLRADLGRRVGTLFAGASASEDDISGQARLRQTESLLDLADSAWPFGHGLSASGQVGVFGGFYRNSGGGVSSNWLIGMWVDGALLALPLIIFVIFMALRGALLPSGQALLLLLVNSLFSNAFFMPVTWFALGLTMWAVTRAAPPAETDGGTEPGVKLRAAPRRRPRPSTARSSVAS